MRGASYRRDAVRLEERDEARGAVGPDEEQQDLSSRWRVARKDRVSSSPQEPSKRGPDEAQQDLSSRWGGA